MGCVCKCVCDQEYELGASGIMLKLVDNNEDLTLIHTDLRDKEVSVSSTKTSPGKSIPSFNLLTTSEDSVSSFSMRKMLGPWREKIYSSLKSRSSLGNSEVSYVFSGEILMEGPLLKYKEEFSSPFIERWCQLSREGFKTFKSRYHATSSSDRPLESFDLKSVRFATKAQVPEKLKRTFPFQFEVFIKNRPLTRFDTGRISSFGSFSDDRPKLKRSFTGRSIFNFSPIPSPRKSSAPHGRMLFCAKTSKEREMWIQAFNELL